MKPADAEVFEDPTVACIKFNADELYMLIGALDFMSVHLQTLPFAAQRLRALDYHNLAVKIDLESVKLAEVEDALEAASDIIAEIAAAAEKPS